MSRLALVLAASLAFAHSPLASAELNATATTVAEAHLDSDSGQSVLVPGPGSLGITALADAEDSAFNSSPPPDLWEMDAMVDGIGTARHGLLTGRGQAEASSLPANDFYSAVGQVTLTLDFRDRAVVVSDSLPPGTPVTLTFAMTLDATAQHVIDELDPDPVGTGASARHEAEVRDVDDLGQLPGDGVLVINSRGDHETFETFLFDTEIGDELELFARLIVTARVAVNFGELSFSQGTAEVLASEAALYFEPAGDVRLESESGHDYAPEPESAGTLAACAALLLLGRREARRMAPSGRRGASEQNQAIPD
jgi:hypothetical protein